MTYQKTTAIDKILSLNKRIKVIQGGTGAGKTIGILLILIDKAQIKYDGIWGGKISATKGNKIISVVSESLPHLKRGAIRDFINIMKDHGYYKDSRWNKTDNIYTFETGNKIEFFGADQEDKVRGPRRDILFINEANNISYETYTQLAIRTNEEIYLDYNPVSDFWVNKEVIGKEDSEHIVLTYKDNEQLPESIVKEIESRKDNKYFWQVYGLGQIGVREGVIYTNWQIIRELPFEAKYVCTGLDFGYTQDPSVIVDICYFNGGYIIDQIAYDTGLNNRTIADILLSSEIKRIVYADSAEPKSIDEIKSYGVNIFAAAKGRDSILHGIQLVQQQKISITEDSVNIIKDFRNYRWKTNKDGISINVPEHTFSHSPDAVRYGIVSALSVDGAEEEFDKIYKRSTFYDATTEYWQP